jgi:3-(3-hydroxy-phenyl)propionate hydroxylase
MTAPSPEGTDVLVRETIVVGAGPVGLTAALALRSFGRPVTVLESGPDGRQRPGSRAIFTHSQTLQILDRLSPGLGAELYTRGVYWNTQRTFFEGREVYAKTYPDPAPGTYPHFTSLPQVQIEEYLYARAVAAGVEFVWGQAVETISSDDDGVRIGTASGTRWQARYVIGADGAHSAVRKQIGARMEGDRDDGWYIVVDVAELPQPALPQERHFHYAHPAVGRNVLIVPFAGGYRVDLQLLDDDDPDALASPAGVHAWLDAVLPAGYADRTTWVSTYQFLQLVAHDFADPARRVLLVGEAAHLFAPFGARGLNSGVPDAEAAASAVVLALNASTGEGARNAVSAFALARRSAALFNRDAAGEALAHLRPTPETAARVREAAARAPADATASTWLEKAPYGPRGVPRAETTYRY